MTNSADSDKLASSESNWSGSTLFAKTEHIQVQQDKGWKTREKNNDLLLFCFLIKAYIVLAAVRK